MPAFQQVVPWVLMSLPLLFNLGRGRAETTSTSTLEDSANELPNFTPLVNVNAVFFEQFTDDWTERWQPSHAKKDSQGSESEEWSYVGQWSVEEPHTFPGIAGDKGLVVKNRAAHHAISAKFPKPLDNTGKTLVVQYEVKPQDGLECGGAYLKLLAETEALHADEFSNASPYVIMFGPDRCGGTNKVHFIFRHRNPRTGEYEEKHMTTPPSAKTVKSTTLYTLIVSDNAEFDVQIDGVSARHGSLLEDFAPPVNPPKEIEDPTDVKPDTWVEEAKIPDPDAMIPDDWDENEPFEIVDSEAVRPADWQENEPLTIPDPGAEKPEDWDDEEDGDWVAPQVANPICESASGCGPWTAPLKKNPAYKGKWSAPLIENPAYQGVWSPRKVTNPDYFEDNYPSNFFPIGAVGFEIWTMQKDILFDNIYVGHSPEEAQRVKQECFDVKKRQEERAQDDLLAKDKKETSNLISLFKADPLGFLQDRVSLFVGLLATDPLQAMKEMPEVAGVAVLAVTTVLAMLFGLTSLFQSDITPEADAASAKPRIDTRENIAETDAD